VWWLLELWVPGPLGRAVAPRASRLFAPSRSILRAPFGAGRLDSNLALGQSVCRRLAHPAPRPRGRVDILPRSQLAVTSTALGASIVDRNTLSIAGRDCERAARGAGFIPRHARRKPPGALGVLVFGAFVTVGEAMRHLGMG
jgi:hypothetical protein